MQIFSSKQQQMMLLSQGQFMFTELVLTGAISVQKKGETTRIIIRTDRYQVYADYELKTVEKAWLHQLANILSRCFDVEVKQAMISVPKEVTRAFIEKSLATTKPTRIIFNDRSKNSE